MQKPGGMTEFSRFKYRNEACALGRECAQEGCEEPGWAAGVWGAL